MEKNNQQDNINRSFTDLVIGLLKWRKLIIWNVFIVTLIATVVSFLVPKWYTSTANILPPKSSGGLLSEITNISSTIKDLSKTLGKVGAASDQAYNFLAILQSRTCSERVIKKFNLRQVYKYNAEDPIEDVIKELQSNAAFSVEDEGNITINVTDKDPKRAADMANYFIEVLNDISITLGTSEARNNREFIERRYMQSLNDLKAAEDSLKNFSEKYSVYSITDQTKAAITVAAELKAKIETQKIERDLMIKNYGKDGPLVTDKNFVINELQKNLDAMKFTGGDSKTKIDLFTPFSQLPEVGVKFLRLKGEYELQTKILEFIIPIYEQAKIEEKKDIPVCLILDAAKPAQKKAGPKRSIIIGASFLISLLLSVIISFVLESLEKLRKDKSQYNKINDGIFIPLRRMFFLKK